MSDEKQSSGHTIAHPAYYGGKDDPFEVIKVVEAFELSFSAGSCLKYLKRAGAKSPEALSEDLRKARWYANRARFHNTPTPSPIVMRPEAFFNEQFVAECMTNGGDAGGQVNLRTRAIYALLRGEYGSCLHAIDTLLEDPSTDFRE